MEHFEVKVKFNSVDLGKEIYESLIVKAENLTDLEYKLNEEYGSDLIEINKVAIIKNHEFDLDVEAINKGELIFKVKIKFESIDENEKSKQRSLYFNCENIDKAYKKIQDNILNNEEIISLNLTNFKNYLD